MQAKEHVRNAGTIIGFSCLYKRGHPFSLTNEEEKNGMLKAIRIMMQQIKKYAPRKDKDGWLWKVVP